jgi:hypothetical protein
MYDADLEKTYAKRLCERLVREALETDDTECRAALHVAINALRAKYLGGQSWGRVIERAVRS